MTNKEIVSLGWEPIDKGHKYKHPEGYYLFYNHVPNKYSIYEIDSNCLNRDENTLVVHNFLLKNKKDLKKVMQMMELI